MSETNYSSEEWDIKPIVLIGILIILFQVGLFLTSETEEYNITDTVYLVLLGLIGVFALILAKKSSIKKFEKSIVFLGIGYFCFLIGDIIFYYYDHVLEIDPYPSPFDVFFIAGYVMLSTFFVSFKKNLSGDFVIKEKTMIILIPIGITIIYAVTAFLQWEKYSGIEFDIIWSSIFTIGSSIVLTISIISFMATKNKNPGILILIPMAVIIGMIAEIWYYYLETFEIYYSSHVVNTIWITSFLLIVYSLMKKNSLVEKSIVKK